MNRARVGERIAEIRKSQGLTQTQLADGSGLGIASIARYEKGTTFPRGDNLQRIAACLKVDSKVFFEEPVQQEAAQTFKGLLDKSIPFSDTQFELLTEASKTKVRQYIADLYAAERYAEEQKENTSSPEEQQARLAAAAELAVQTDDSQNEKKA